MQEQETTFTPGALELLRRRYGDEYRGAQILAQAAAETRSDTTVTIPDRTGVIIGALDITHTADGVFIDVSR